MAPDDEKPDDKPVAAELDPVERQVADKVVQTVKQQLLDAQTQADLARWFSLPSFQELEDRGVKPKEAFDDPEVVAIAARRAQIVAEIDPALVDGIHATYEQRAWELLKFTPNIDVHVRTDLVKFDAEAAAQIGNTFRLVDLREREIWDDLREDMRDVTPQALLRDLHRPEMFFDKLFERVDYGAEQRMDIVAAVAEAMRMDLKLPPFGRTPFQDVTIALREDRALGYRGKWLDEIRMPNREVKE